MDRGQPPKATTKHWSPNEDAFRQLLDWLDQGTASDGESYLEIHRRLVRYFDRRGCVVPHDLADETLNRVARRLSEPTAIDAPPAAYCYVVAKFVFLESLREARPDQESPGLRTGSAAPAAAVETQADDNRSRSLLCLERCLDTLAPAERELILDYYRGETRVKIEQRRTLAQRLGLTANAVALRACRIRSKLEACVRESHAGGLT
jgi:DNA-directed RNA polymerase specialized sigma24 family protein